MIIPFRRHLDWLVLEGTPVEGIVDFYDNIQFPFVGEDIIKESEDRVGQLVLPPSVKRNAFKKKYIPEDTPFWERLGYGDFHRQRCLTSNTLKNRSLEKAWTMVGKVLNHSVMRIALDVCLIRKVAPDRIVEILPMTFKTELSEEALDLYKRCFGDFESFQVKDWRAYLNLLVDNHYVYTRIFAALTKTDDEAFFLCGLPTEKQLGDFLKNVLATSDMKFRHYSRRSDPVSDNEARKWAAVGMHAGEMFDKYGGQDAADFSKLVQTEFDYIQPNFPVLDEA